MAEYSANAVQTVNPGEAIIFTEVVDSCKRGLIRHRNETGSFLLSGWAPRMRRCCCRTGNDSVDYLVDFGCNVAIPTGGTVEPISVALTIDGATIPASTMISTPAAVDEFDNISRAISADIWKGCCETLSVINTTAQPIQVQNANIIITRPDLNVTY